LNLPDPDQRMAGTGAKMHHVKVRSVAQARTPAVRDLITAALAERWQALRS